MIPLDLIYYERTGHWNEAEHEEALKRQRWKEEIKDVKRMLVPASTYKGDPRYNGYDPDRPVAMRGAFWVMRGGPDYWDNRPKWWYHAKWLDRVIRRYFKGKIVDMSDSCWHKIVRRTFDKRYIHTNSINAMHNQYLPFAKWRVMIINGERKDLTYLDPLQRKELERLMRMHKKFENLEKKFEKHLAEVTKHDA